MKNIILEWTEVSGSAEVIYNVTWNSTDACGSKIVKNNKATTKIEDLTSNDRYDFQVQASNQGGQGMISDHKTILTSKQ